MAVLGSIILLHVEQFFQQGVSALPPAREGGVLGPPLSKGGVGPMDPIQYDRRGGVLGGSAQHSAVAIA
jgi:hypothetical protein